MYRHVKFCLCPKYLHVSILFPTSRHYILINELSLLFSSKVLVVSLAPLHQDSGQEPMTKLRSPMATTNLYPGTLFFSLILYFL